MTQEEKELLLCDISARLPYGLKCKCPILSHEIYTIVSIELNDGYPMVGLNTTRDSYIYAPLEEVKPYLHPMSSMTEEERELLKQEHLKDERLYIEAINGDGSMRGKVITHYAADWCNKNHFDYRGLIPMGLALEAPKNMYNI